MAWGRTDGCALIHQIRPRADLRVSELRYQLPSFQARYPMSPIVVATSTPSESLSRSAGAVTNSMGRMCAGTQTA